MISEKPPGTYEKSILLPKIALFKQIVLNRDLKFFEEFFDQIFDEFFDKLLKNFF